MEHFYHEFNLSAMIYDFCQVYIIQCNDWDRDYLAVYREEIYQNKYLIDLFENL